MSKDELLTPRESLYSTGWSNGQELRGNNTKLKVKMLSRALFRTGQAARSSVVFSRRHEEIGNTIQVVNFERTEITRAIAELGKKNDPDWIYREETRELVFRAVETLPEVTSRIPLHHCCFLQFSYNGVPLMRLARIGAEKEQWGADFSVSRFREAQRENISNTIGIFGMLLLASGFVYGGVAISRRINYDVKPK